MGKPAIDMGVYIFYVLIGIVAGAFAGLIFVTLNHSWKKASFSTVIFMLTFVILRQLNSYIKSFGLENETKASFITASVLYLVFFLMAFSLIFILVCYLIKTQKEKVRIRVLDIVLNYSDLLKMYYESRQREIDQEIDRENLKKTNQLAAWEISLQESSKALEEQSREALKISLPLNGAYL